jgi:hypothetical protein
MAHPATAVRATGDDATPERLRHAKDAGVAVSRAEIYTASGQATGQKRRQLEHPLDSAAKRGWITPEQHAAGCRIRALMDGARANPRITSKYLAAVDGEGSSGLSDNDRREYCARAYIKAESAIRARERKQFISWLEDCELMDMSVAMLGKTFTPRQHPQAVSELAIHVLGNVLTDLADHFGYSRKIAKKHVDMVS